MKERLRAGDLKCRMQILIDKTRLHTSLEYCGEAVHTWALSRHNK